MKKESFTYYTTALINQIAEAIGKQTGETKSEVIERLILAEQKRIESNLKRQK